jgi:hypothetical protein
MANFADLTLVGPGAVNWVFKPRSNIGGEATYVKSTGVPLADQVLKIKPSRTTSGRVRVDYSLSIPVVQDMTVNGVTKPTIVRTAYFRGTFTADSGSSTTERLEMIELAGSAMGSAVGLDVFKDLGFIQ